MCIASQRLNGENRKDKRQKVCEEFSDSRCLANTNLFHPKLIF